MVKQLIFISVLLAGIMSLKTWGSQDKTKPVVALFSSFPEAFQNDAGEYQGTLVDVFNAFEQAVNKDMDQHVMPWPRIMALLGSTSYDFTFLFNVPVFREKVYFLGSIGCFADVIVPRKGIVIEGIDSLKGKTVAYMQKGAFARKYTDTELFAGIPSRKADMMMRLLVNGRVDAIVIHSGHYYRLLNTLEPGAFFPENWREMFGTPWVHKLYDIQLTLSRQSSYRHLIPVAQAAIKSEKEKGTFRRIHKKWQMPFWPCKEQKTG